MLNGPYDRLVFNDCIEITIMFALLRMVLVLWAIVNTPVVYGPAGLPAETHTVNDNYRPLFESNLFGMASITSSFMPMLIASRGRVVNTGSIAGLMAIPNNISYVAVESAIFMWSEALRYIGLPFLSICVDFCQGKFR